MNFAIYDKDTKEFIRIEEGSLNPLESEKQRKPVYLVPANSTKVIPTEKEGYANVWDGTSWNFVEDNRGAEYWLPNETYYDEPHEMKELGELPKGAKTSRPIKPTPTIEEQNEAIRQARQTEYEKTSDILFRDYQEALARGDSNTEQLKQAWLASKDKVRADNPYVGDVK